MDGRLRRLGLGLLLVAGCTPLPGRPWQASVASDHALVGRVYDVHAAAWIDPRALAATLRMRPYALLGEKHDNPDHHRLQAWLVGEMAKDGRRPLVALEMLDSAQQPALDACIHTCVDLVAELPDHVAWAKSGWPDYALYAPIIRAAASAHLPIVAANLPAVDVRRLVRGDTAVLPPDSAAARALDDPVPPAVAKSMQAEIEESHCGHAPAALVAGMIRGQRARDATMATALGAAPDGGILIAGAGHVRRDWGVPAYLPAGAGVASVAFLEVRPDATDPTAYLPASTTEGPVYDYVWFTPRVDLDDPCARFREQLEHMKATHPAP